jgi:hypothetical protein
MQLSVMTLPSILPVFASFLLGLLFDHEDGGDTFPQIVELPLNCMTATGDCTLFSCTGFLTLYFTASNYLKNRIAVASIFLFLLLSRFGILLSSFE